MARRIKTRSPNTTILIVVEGETERVYFNQMRSMERYPGITVIPKIAKHSSPVHVLEMAITEMAEKIYDYVWCVFDTDVLETTRPKDYVKRRKDAAKAGILVAESFPAFELWFLLHFAIPKGHISSQDRLITELERHIDGYSKESHWQSAKGLYAFLKPFLDQAIENATELEKRNADTSSGPRMSTSVHTLLSQIRTLAEIGKG